VANSEQEQKKVLARAQELLGQVSALVADEFDRVGQSAADRVPHVIVADQSARLVDELRLDLRQQRADRLGLCSVFESLNRAELSAIGNQFIEISLSADKQFIFEGENDPTLYILVGGKLEVFTKDDDGNEIHIAYVDPIEPIGEMGYFQGGIRTASVRTVVPTEFLSAAYKNLTHYFEHVPHVAHAFLDVINRRQNETNERLKNIEH